MPLSLDTLTGRSQIGQAGDVLYVPVPGHAVGAIWVVDVSDPASPEELAVVELDHLPVSVSASGNLAAVIVREFTGPALFFDIADPENPQLLGEHEHSLTSLPPSIEFVDSRLYVVDFRGVTILDIHPEHAGRAARGGNTPQPGMGGAVILRNARVAGRISGWTGAAGLLPGHRAGRRLSLRGRQRQWPEGG